MSELIDNHRQRQEELKKIIRDVRSEQDADDIKERFAELLATVGPAEIAHLEQELIKEGMPAEEIKSLCDVHTKVFVESLAQQEKPPEEQGGHPIHTYKKENRAVEGVMNEIRAQLDQIMEVQSLQEATPALDEWKRLHTQLLEVEKHFSRKENILFAYLDKHDVSGPSSVMWAIQDDIRDELKKVSKGLAAPLQLEEIKELIAKTVRPAFVTLDELIYKEENIMLPTAMEVLSEGEWAAQVEQGEEIGYCLTEPDSGWIPTVPPEPVAPGSFSYGHDIEGGEKGKQPILPFETGILSLEQVSLIFNHLPLDITFVDKDDTVRYFSYGKERIFQRSKAIIGRKVQNCHPPDSVHIVETIVADLKSGKRDSADFWIKMGPKFVYIRYFAVRDNNGEYAGCLEVTQEVSEIRALEGEKRIYDEA